ncbi:MAG: hypothetical protein R3F13_07135 [Prosthecobacter sp.]
MNTFFRLFSLLLVLSVHTAAQTITSIQVFDRGGQGGTTDLIASDVSDGNAATNRHRIDFETQINVPSAGDYQLRYQLIDENDAVVVSDSQTLGSIAAGNHTRSWNFAVFPTQLDPYQKHRLRVKLIEGQPTGPPLNTIIYLVEVDSETEATGRTYFHFTNTTSSDAPFNVISRVTSTNFGTRKWILDTQPGSQYVVAACSYELRRWDAFSASTAPSNNISVTLEAELHRESDDALVQVMVSGAPADFVTVPLTVSTTGWTQPAAIREPTTTTGIFANIQLDPAVQLDSKNERYYVRTRIKHVDETGQPAVTGNSLDSAIAQLFHFNGNLAFGGIATTFSHVATITTANTTTPALNVAVDQQSGVIAGFPNHTYGDGTALLVHLEPDGDATYQSVVFDVPVTGPANDTDTFANVSFQRSGLELLPTGLFGSVTVTLPAGVGFTESANSNLLNNTLQKSGVALGANLAPTFPVVFDFPVGAYFHEETKPVLYQTSSLTWQAPQGKFDLGGPVTVSSVHRPYLDALDANPNVPGAQKVKPSNDGYWRHVAGGVVSVSITAGPGGVGRVDAQEIVITAGKNFIAHHPKQSPIAWTGAGSITLIGDKPDPDTSRLVGVNAVQVTYARHCLEVQAECPGAGTSFVNYIMTPDITPEGRVLHFTPNGGLHGTGDTLAGHLLGWGRLSSAEPVVHQAQSAFVRANFLMAGHFLSENAQAVFFGAGPGFIFNTGVDVANVQTLEVPGTSEYNTGAGDYPGMNVRASGADAGKQMISRLGGQASSPYTLAANSKFYARWSGVSGVQQATSGITLPSPSLFGFPAQIDTFGLSWLSNDNLLSRTDGELQVVAPANITFPFDDLTFTCLGAPAVAGMAGGPLDRTLEYWNAPIRIFGLEFVPADDCDPSAGCLALACSLSAQNVPVPLVGTLGLRPDGQITAPGQADNCGIDSEFVLPAVTQIAGPRRTATEDASSYAFTPVRLAYLNTESEDNRPAGADRVGFWSLAGTLDVPFFENVEVHGHTSANPAAPTSELHLTGGFASGPKTFFTDPSFDNTHAARPSTLNITNYRTSASHRAHAKQNWLELFEMNYPLSWSSARRSFRGSATSNVDLLVLTAQSQVDYLDPHHANLSFGVQYEGLPRISISNALFNAIDEQTGVASSIVEAAGQQVFDRMEGGVDAFADLLSDQADRLIGEVVDQLIDPGLNNFVDVVKDTAGNAIAANQNVREEVKDVVDLYLRPVGAPPPPNGEAPAPPPAPITPLQNTLAGFVGTIGAPSGLVPSVDLKLGAINDSLFAIAGNAGEIGNPLPGGAAGLLGRSGLDEFSPRVNATSLITNVVGDFAPQFNAVIQQAPVFQYLDEASASLDQIKASLDQIRASVQALKGSLANGQEFLAELSEFQLQLDLLLVDASLDSFLNSLADAVQEEIDAAFDRIEENLPTEAEAEAYVEGLRDQIKARVRRELRDRLMASAAIANMRTAIRERLQVVHLAFREAVDAAFEEINAVIRQALSAHIAGLDDSLNDYGKKINEVVKSGRIAGHAHIEDDALRELRLDARIELGVPQSDPFRFDGFFRFQQLNSTGPGGCPGPGQVAAANLAEVTLGARDASLEWITPGMKANITGQLGFKTDVSPAIPISVGGSFEMTEGAMEFATAEVEELRGTMKIGIAPDLSGFGENYLGLAGSVRISGSGLEGGMFIGRSCDLEPINLINPQLGDLLGSGGFAGGYVFGAGRIPIVDFGCVFNVSAGVGLGAFYSVPGPTWGGLAQLSCSGEALCLISVRGSVDLVGVKRGDDFRFSGQGRISGKAGPCPLCKRFRKTVRFTYQNGDWDADY